MNILFKKIIANFIDIFASLIIRLIICGIILAIFKDSIIIASEDLIKKTEGILNSKEVIMIFLEHAIFKIILSFIILFALIGSLYQIYFHSSSWCATIGQRIMKIVMVKDDGQYVTIPLAILHHILSLIPLFTALYFISFIIIYNNKYRISNISDLITIFYANNFNIFMIIIMILWINIPIFIKSKKSVPDIICKMKIDIGRTDNRFPKIRW
jgi:uncharacterized RDD family membrane protein YckC